MFLDMKDNVIFCFGVNCLLKAKTANNLSHREIVDGCGSLYCINRKTNNIKICNKVFFQN